MCPRAGKYPILPIFVCYVHGLFDDLEFRYNLCQNFSWKTVNTLAMEPVSPHGQNVPFWRSNVPHSWKIHNFADFHVLCPWTFWWSGFRYNFCRNFSWTTVTTLAMELVSPHGQSITFWRSKCTPELVNPPFCRFSCAIVHGLFGDLQFRHIFCHNFLWTSIKTLDKEQVNHRGENVLFTWSNDPRIS